jgi:hypothetical protein
LLRLPRRGVTYQDGTRGRTLILQQKIQQKNPAFAGFFYR